MSQMFLRHDAELRWTKMRRAFGPPRLILELRCADALGKLLDCFVLRVVSCVSI